MRKLIIPFLVFGISFVYYIYQACPTFYFWDSAELTAAVLGNGVPHPPGFPSLLIAAKIWNGVLPLNEAYSLNLLSGFFASLGLLWWYLTALNILHRLFPERRNAEHAAMSLVSVIAVGLSFSYTIQAVRFEVYSLNFACFALLFYLALKVSFNCEKNRILYPLIMIAVTAISLGAHHFTMALTFPGILLLIYFHKRLKPKSLLYFMISTFVLIVPLYLSIYLLALKSPALDWGDPSNIKNFIDYFFLREFETPVSRLAPGHLADNLSFAIGLITAQIGILGSLFGLWGIVKFVRLSPKTAIPLMIIIILNIFSISYFEDYFYDNYDLHGYLIFSVALLSLFMVAIIGFLSGLLHGLVGKKISGENGTDRLLVLIAIAAVILYLPLKKNIFSANLSGTADAEQYGDLFIGGAPENSVIITSYYNTYFCLLAYRALYPMDDNRIITNVYNWEHDWGRRRTAAFLGFDPNGDSTRSDFYRSLLNRIKDIRPVYVEFDDASAPLINYLKPSGLGYRFSVSDTSAINPLAQAKEANHYFQIATRSKDIESIRTWVLWFQNRGEYYRMRGTDDLAAQYFEASEEIASLRKRNGFRKE